MITPLGKDAAKYPMRNDIEIIPIVSAICLTFHRVICYNALRK